jgi:hypothetical protein
VQADVVPAQPARQELHHVGLPCAALQVGAGLGVQASLAVSLAACSVGTCAISLTFCMSKAYQLLVCAAACCKCVLFALWQCGCADH